MAGLISGDFSGDFSGNFFFWPFCPWNHFFAFVRSCPGFIRLPSALMITSRECLEWLMLAGQMNVRRMSGDWIASVCRLCARAPNYRPTILLSCFPRRVFLVGLIWGLCCVPILKELLGFARNVVFGLSPSVEKSWTHKLALVILAALHLYASSAKVNKLSAEISVAEMLWCWLEVIQSRQAHLSPDKRWRSRPRLFPTFLVTAG